MRSVEGLVRVRPVTALAIAVASTLLLVDVPAAAQSVTTVPLVVNNLAYDPIGGLLYASLPSRAVAHPNTIATINPSNGEVLSYIAVGSDPNQMATTSPRPYVGPTRPGL
jgi:hypothetical protein